MTKYFLMLGLLITNASFANDAKTVTLISTTGQAVEVFESELRAAYVKAFSLGKSTNYEKAFENEDRTVTLIAPKYKVEGINYPVAMFHLNKENASGICKLYGFSSFQSYEQSPQKNIVCAFIDGDGHFFGLRPSHMENGKESLYDCLAKITCIP